MTQTSAAEGLRDGFAGRIIVPGDPDFDEARTIFNGMIDKRPSVIAQVADTADVRRAIAFGRAEGLEIAVRGGGHSVAGKALTDGGIVIDLRNLNQVTVDPDARTAVVAGGATMGHLDRGTEPFGLATTGGRVSTTGVGGFTLGGGGGWLDRKFGLAADNVLAYEVVTADGEIVRATEDEHPDLFWALHGGGGNFGVVTSFTFRLHELPAVTAALLVFREDDGQRAVLAFRDFMEAAPDDIGGGVLYLTAPPEEFVPDHLHGKLACAILLVYAGGEDDARRSLAPMLELGHAGEMIAEMPYADLQSMLDDPPGYRNYWSVEYLGELPDAAVDAFVAAAPRMVIPSPSQHVLFPQGGAVARGPSDWPLPWRAAPWCVHPFAMWEDPADDERARAWTREVRDAMQPWASGDVYLNFIGDEGTDRTVAAFGRSNYDRLTKVKRAYDPENVFRVNHNIAPA